MGCRACPWNVGPRESLDRECASHHRPCKQRKQGHPCMGVGGVPRSIPTPVWRQQGPKSIPIPVCGWGPRSIPTPVWGRQGPKHPHPVSKPHDAPRGKNWQAQRGLVGARLSWRLLCARQDQSMPHSRVLAGQCQGPQGTLWGVGVRGHQGQREGAARPRGSGPALSLCWGRSTPQAFK